MGGNTTIMTTQSIPEKGHLLRNLLLFGRVLRRLGLDVNAARMLDVVQALEYIGIRRKGDFYHALRSMLVHRQPDLALFDEAFEVFWRRPSGEGTTMDLRSLGEHRRFRQPQVGPPPPDAGPALEGDQERDANADVDRVDLTRTYSAREVLRTKEFSKFTAEEVAEAREMMATLQWDLGMRRTRRWTRGRGPAFDLRRTVRHSLDYGGELIELAHRERKDKRRPLVLICDISGSMERYTRMLLHLVHSIAGSLDHVEVFLFATRLTRVTRHLAHRGVDKAVEEVTRAVPDWSGGTRAGEALKTFNFRWARRVMGRGTVVLIISDGWDRGEPELLRREMARLQRTCHRLIWLNPLLGSASYEPLTRGMQAALPFIDDFLPVRDLVSLEVLARHLNTLSPQRPLRRQHVSGPPSDPSTTTEASLPPASPSPHSDANPTFRHPLWGRSGT